MVQETHIFVCRETAEGIPLYLQISVVNSNDCQSVSGAGVEIWHCDAVGIYSHFEAASQNQGSQTDNSTYLRGIQVTGDTGAVNFTSIYPGWYTGRALHIHMKVHQGGTEGAVIHTGQLFFEETLNEAVEVESPYSTHTVTRLTNAEDNIYNNGGSYGLISTWNYVDESDISQGIQASITVEVDAVTSTASSTTVTPSVTPSAAVAASTTSTASATPTPAATTEVVASSATPTPSVAASSSSTPAASPSVIVDDVVYSTYDYYYVAVDGESSSASELWIIPLAFLALIAILAF